MKTVNGFDIPLRKLTDEEKTRPVTWERFRDFHYAVGEDFLDQTGEGNVYIFAGWLLHKYPEHSADILRIVNKKYAEIQNFNELEFLGYSDELDIDLLYCDFAEFVNLTGALKERVNQILIQVTEYYEK